MTSRARPRSFAADELELDLARHELRRAGAVVRLERHPMNVLILLMERGGDVVTREEIAGRLWQSGTHVAVDEGINTAIRKLREALADDPRRPRYVATVVGKGYRFLPPVRPGTNGGRASLPSIARLVWGERSVALVEGDHVIGRDAGAAVCLESHTVSRRHARLRIGSDAAVLEDLGSKNGTFVNGARVAAPRSIKEGDRIDIGGVRLAFVRLSRSRTRTVLRG